MDLTSVNGCRYARTASCVNKQLGSVPSLAAKARFVPSFLEPNWKQAHRKTVCGEI
jgi:hypothetical protein